MDQRLLLMHQTMLADAPRLHAYDQALEQTVDPGDVVVDVGAGTLALSLLALRHGAGHVYAVEADPRMAEVAARIIEANDLKDRLTLIVGDARTLRLPDRADVLVSEMMGNLGPEEEMAEVLGVVARRVLRPDGRVVPRRLVTRLAAIEFDAEGWGLWSSDFLGHRLDVVQELVEPQAHLHFFQRPPRLLSEPVPVADSALGRAGSTRPRPSQRLRVVRPGTLHAVMGYFTADMADGVELSNFPSYPGCNWAVWIWPLRHTRVAEGDELRLDLRRPRAGTGVRLATDWRLDCGIVRAGRS
ncbi:class I SAM-dependent methyltransferase [Micromonospora sp. WMMD1128]|uniref:methyltransferase domain-containing protein n=1 Tax=unclassified Micromonospora TaxID=2617518 RepID=UPI00248D10CE|nr:MULTISPECIES: class I SAM-dependent methyltransferase [unclassified Micromonospora]WBB75823.1 class I SAM-dependent methyltransferase [Micromonospora sp. WMMD1128]WFE36387.1 class I SAM-dependent methyltransferase [Micromonospora sp. WMMD975]